MITSKVVEFVLAFIGVLGVIGVAIPKLWGIYFICISQIGFIVYFIYTRQFFLSAQNFCLFILNVFAIWSWTNKGIGF
jgi:hypothetical protein